MSKTTPPEAAPMHLISLNQLEENELREILALAASLKREQRAGRPHRRLEGKTLGMIFEKASTRTRVSFEVGMFQLGGHALNLTAEHSQIGRGEPPQDTARVLSRYVDILMVRTFSQETLENFAQHASVPVINGLTDRYHPCQLLADLQTVEESKGRLEGWKYAWIGDGNNMSHSWINAAAVLGLDLTLATPKGYEPNAEIVEWAKKNGNGEIRLTHSAAEAAEGADVVSTDVWASMGDEDEAEARREAFKGFTLDTGLIESANPEVTVLHCLPAHRGEEISNGVLEAHADQIFEEAENRLHAQKALMCRLLGAGRSS